jgi:thymidylate synthase (FAD)
MTIWNDVKDDPRAIKVLDHGFVVLMDVMGSDAEICQAARCSYGQGTKSVSSDRALIRYLMRNWHTSPLEMVELKFLIKMPIFVMRQHVRHRTASLNEYSGRYSEMTDEMYLPPLDRFQKQHVDNKQASGEQLSELQAKAMQSNMSGVFEQSYSSYQQSIQDGLAREVARIQLPLSNYTELYWKIDLKNFLHYVFLRDDNHAQKEIQVYAQAMYDLVKPLVPFACEAFEDYWCASSTAHMSRMELELLGRLIDKNRWLSLVDMHRSEAAVAEKFGMSAKEVREFKEKLGL